MILLLALFAALQVQHVFAHGYVSQIFINGNRYAGNAPGRDTAPSPIRTVATDGPVQNTSSPELACGVGASNAPFDAEAGPGSVVNFTWVSGSGGNWPHEVGPVLTYMASCDNATSCVSFNTTGARWFKINEAGKMSDGTTWVQQDIMEGWNFNVTLPENLAPGGYLLRNEIIGLQNGMSPGGAEFFPSCTQLRVGGNDTGMPTPNDTVTFPGAYNATDPGILFDAYTDPRTPYVFPGPPVSTLVNATAQTLGQPPDPVVPSPGKNAEPLASLPISTSPEDDPDMPLASLPISSIYPSPEDVPEVPLADAMPVIPVLVERGRQFHRSLVVHLGVH